MESFLAQEAEGAGGLIFSISQLRQFRHVGLDPARFVAGQHLRRRPPGQAA